MKPIQAQTDDATFRIINVRRTKRSVSYQVDTNMNALIMCYLLNRKPQVLASFKISPESNQKVTFWDVNRYEKLLTKCEMYDTNNHLLMSTSVDEIPAVTSFWRSLYPYLIICVLLYIINRILKYKRHADIMVSIVDADDSESIRLLRTLASPSVLITGKTRDVMDETSATVKCGRCGFMNSKYSTVCKDCNALLHEEGFFKDAKETAYFCSVCFIHESRWFVIFRLK